MDITLWRFKQSISLKAGDEIKIRQTWVNGICAETSFYIKRSDSSIEELDAFVEKGAQIE